MVAGLGAARGSIVLDISQALRSVQELKSNLASLGRAGLGSFDTSAARSSLSGVQQQATQLGAQVNQAIGGTQGTWSRMGGWIDQNERHITALGQAATGVGLVFTGVATGGVMMAANFEEGMSLMSVATGATGDELEKLRALSLQLGADTSFSAGEAAAAITELGKAGLSVEDIYGGAAEAVVNLAAAGEIDLATSANILTQAMAQYGLAASDATMITDVLARGAAVSTAEIDGLAQGLVYVGGTAKNLGIPINDTTAALSALNDQGLRGSMAGTTLNQALSSIINPSAKAKGAMDDLGLSMGGTFSLINDDGSFKSLGEIIENVDTATKDLTQTERARYLNMIFGEQGGRAINGLLATQTEEARAAGKSWDDYAAGMNEGTTAADMAAARLDNLKGDLEALGGSIETVAIKAFSGFLPIGRALVQAVTGLVNIFGALPSPIQAAIGGMIGLTGVVALAGGGFLLMLPRINDTIKALNAFKQTATGMKVAGAMTGGFSSIGTALKTMTTNMRTAVTSAGGLRGALMGVARAHPVLAGISLAAAGIGIAYKTNFLGLRDTVDGAVAGVKSLGSDMMAAFNQGAESASIAADQVASFAEATHVVDGVTMYTAFHTNAEGEQEKVGEIVESIANADGKTAQVLIKGEDGEYWATIDLATGEISEAQIPVTADTQPLNERINGALEVLKGRFDAAGLGWGVSLVSGLQTAVNAIAALMVPVGAFIDRVKAQFTSLNMIMNPFSALMVGIGRALSTIDFGPLQGIANALSAAFVNLGYGIQRIGEGARQVISAIAAAWQGDFSAALDHARNALDLFGEGFGDLADAANNIGAVIGGALGLIGSYLQQLAARFPVVGDSLRAIGSAFKQAGEVAREVFDTVASVLRGDLSGALDNLGDFVEDIGKLFLDQFEAVGEVVGDLGDLIQRGLAWAFDSLRSRFSAFTSSFDRIQDVLSNVVGVVKNLGEALASLARGDISGFFSNLGDAAMDALQAIGNAMVMIPTIIWEAFQAIDWGGVASALQEGATEAIEGLQNLSDQFLNWLQESADAINFGAILDVIQSGLTSALAGLRVALDWALDTGIPAIAGWIVDIAGDVWGGIKRLAGWASDSVSGVVHLALDMLDSLGEAALAAFTSAKDWVVSHIPWLAGPLGAAGELLSGAVNLAMKIAGTIANALGEAWSSITSLLGTVGSWIASFFGIGDDGTSSGTTTTEASAGFSFSFALAGAIANGLGQAWSSLTSLIGSAGDWLVGFFNIGEDGTVAGAVLKQASAAFNFAMQFAGAIANGLGAAWSSVTALVGDAASWLVDFFGIDEQGNTGGLITKAASAAFNFAMQFLGAIANGLGEVWSSFTGLVGSVGDWLVDFFGIGDDGSMTSLVSKSASAAVNFAAEFGSEVTDNLGSAWDSVTDLVGSVSSVAKDLVDSAWGGVTKTVNAALHFVVELSGEISDAFGGTWDFIFGGGGEEAASGGEVQATLQTRLDQIATDIEIGLSNIATAITGFDAAGLVSDLNTKLLGAFDGMSGQSISFGMASWINRAAALVPVSVTAAAMMPIANGVDTALGAAFTGAMSGASLATSIAGWIGLAVPQVAALILPHGLALARGMDASVTAGFGALSGGNLATQISAWFTRATPTAIVGMTALGLALARGIDSAMTSGLGALSGGNLSTNIVSWINRAQTTAASTVDMTTLANGVAQKLQRAIEPALQSIVTAFNRFATDIRTAMGRVQADASREADTMARNLQRSADTAQRDVTTAFNTLQRNVSSATREMVSAARTAGNDLASAIRTGAQHASSALQGEASRWAGVITSAGGAAISSARTVGARIGQGVAEGMRSALGDITAAANEIVRQADRAINAAAKVGSPARRFYPHGSWMTKGVAAGQVSRDALASIKRAAGTVVDTLDSAYQRAGGPSIGLGLNSGRAERLEAAWAGGRGGGGMVISNTWHISQQPGESGGAFAERVLGLMTSGYIDGGEL